MNQERQLEEYQTKTSNSLVEIAYQSSSNYSSKNNEKMIGEKRVRQTADRQFNEFAIKKRKVQHD